MLALDEYRASRCPCGCGHNTADSLAKEGTVHRFKARKVRCLARTAWFPPSSGARTSPRTGPSPALVDRER
jgi:hypothetical protein